jgi:ADP-ribose pyrophosphatase YjhB (NUDIX family)
MVRHRHHGEEWWCLPGGAVEKGETPAEATLRELKEESCVDGVIIRETSALTYTPDDKANTFLIDIGDQKPQMGIDPNHANQVIIDVKWLSLAEIPERRPGCWVWAIS